VIVISGVDAPSSITLASVPVPDPVLLVCTTSKLPGVPPVPPDTESKSTRSPEVATDSAFDIVLYGRNCVPGLASEPELAT